MCVRFLETIKCYLVVKILKDGILLLMFSVLVIFLVLWILHIAVHS